jgi:hypothetical protein
VIADERREVGWEGFGRHGSESSVSAAAAGTASGRDGILRRAQTGQARQFVLLTLLRPSPYESHVSGDRTDTPFLL